MKKERKREKNKCHAEKGLVKTVAPNDERKHTARNHQDGDSNVGHAANGRPSMTNGKTWKDASTYERITVWLTITAILAAFTAAYIYHGQLEVMRRTLDEMKSGTKIAQDSANAAGTAAKIAGDSLELSQSAYMHVRATPSLDMPRGIIQLVLINSGHLPARSIVANTEQAWGEVANPPTGEVVSKDPENLSPFKFQFGSGPVFDLPIEADIPISAFGKNRLKSFDSKKDFFVFSVDVEYNNGFKTVTAGAQAFTYVGAGRFQPLPVGDEALARAMADNYKKKDKPKK